MSDDIREPKKALGRCAETHVNVVTVDNLKSACGVCGKPNVEWAVRYAPKTVKNSQLGGSEPL